jgi:hypothetical protein
LNRVVLVWAYRIVSSKEAYLRAEIDISKLIGKLNPDKLL